MNKLIVVVSILSISTGSTGCKDDKKADPAAKPGGDDVAATPKVDDQVPGSSTKFPPELAAWDKPERRKAWQGAWSGDGDSLGDKAAWNVVGDKVTYVNKKGEKQMTLKFESPCSATRQEKTADGGTMGTTSVFTIKDGALITGLGSAGTRDGDKAIVCASGKILLLDAKGCVAWSVFFERWENEPAECGFKKDGEKDVFWYKAHGSESTLLVDGDVIWSEQLRDNHARSHADFAAAKAAQGL